MFVTLDSPSQTRIKPRIEEVEIVASVRHKDTLEQTLNLSSFYTLLDLSISSPLTAAKNRISEIEQLKDNWDNYGAIPPHHIIIKNSFKFLDLLKKIGITNIESNDIYPMPYGSIVIDINNNNGLVSIEIGNNSVGFFTDFESYNNISSKGDETDFTFIPKNLEKALSILQNGV